MAELPSGTVTFLFTDVEGSTELLKGLGGDYARSYRSTPGCCAMRPPRTAATRWDGGRRDVLLVRARRPGRAGGGRRPARARRVLRPGDRPIRVRMGLHTGEPGGRVRVRRHGPPSRGADLLGGARRAGAADGDDCRRARGRAGRRRRHPKARRVPPQGHGRAGADLPAGRRRAPGRVSAATSGAGCRALAPAFAQARARCDRACDARGRRGGRGDRPRQRRRQERGVDDDPPGDHVRHARRDDDAADDHDDAAGRADGR